MGTPCKDDVIRDPFIMDTFKAAGESVPYNIRTLPHRQEAWDFVTGVVWPGLPPHPCAFFFLSKSSPPVCCSLFD